MDPITKKKFIEEKTKIVEEYMAEIEFQLKSGLDLIELYKKEAKLETDEFQDKIVSIIKKIEFCAATVESELDVEGAPTYYIANGRINVADSTPTFTITQVDDDDDDDDDSDSDSVSDSDSDASFTEEERKHIKTPEHYNFLKRYSLKPSAEFSFNITQNLDDISLSSTPP
jgi:hypothetical protein